MEAGREVRITIVGGGSANWAPKLLADLAHPPTLRGHLVLMDIDSAALQTMTGLGRKMMAGLGGRFRVEGVTDLDAALQGADYVVLTINTGGYPATRQDLEIPERYGVFQTVGDTVGPGGLMRGLRNAPVVVGIAQRMAALCPGAWLLNYSNPMGILCQAAALATGITVVGLCHELQGLERTLQTVLGLERQGQVALRVGGINHFSWVLEAWLDGQSVFPRLREHARTLHRADISYDEMSPYADQTLVKFLLLEATGALGVAGDRHIVESYRNFLSPESECGWTYGVKRTTADEFEQAFRDHRAWAQGMLAGQEALPDRHSGETVFQIIEARERDLGRPFFVNLPNVGQIANLPQGRVVVTYALVGAHGLAPLALGELPPSVAPQVRLHSDIQEMVVQAALTSDKSLARQAFCLDPLMPDFRASQALFEEMCQAQGLFQGGRACPRSC
ncbi:MAG: hypothetical protein GX605_11650 [Chloroflexi bacterium]|nr:hypothetical protein [Chloroflexota bacterium]